MPLSGQTISGINSLMEEDFGPGVNAQVLHNVRLLRMFGIGKHSGKVRDGGGDVKFTKTDTHGRYHTKRLHAAMNPSYGARAEGGALPKPGSQTYDDANFYRAHLYSRFKISGPTIDAGMDAVIDSLEKEVQGCALTLQRHGNRVLHGDGSGLLATCVSASDSGGRTTIQLMTSANGPGSAVTNSKQWNGAQYLRKDDPVCVVLRATGDVNGVGVAGTDADPVTVYSVDKVNGTVTLSTTVAAAASIGTTYGIYMHGNWSNTTGSGRTLEPYGLGNICSESNPGSVIGTDPNGYFGAIDRSAAPNAYWKGLVLPASTPGVLRDPSTNLIQTAFDMVEENGNGTVKFMIGNYAVIRKCAEILLPERRVNYESVLKGGYTGFKFNDVWFVRDKDAPPHTLRGGNDEAVELLQEAPIGVANADGNSMRMAAESDDYIGVWKWRFQLGCGACNEWIEIQDISHG